MYLHTLYTTDVSSDFPRNYMLDEYGESRTRGEMYARKAAKRGALNGVFLRPTFVYGQGKSQKMEKIKDLVQRSALPFITGERRGQHQFMYAGNLAALAEQSFFALLQDPKRCNGEIVFCMDENCAYSIRDVSEEGLETQLMYPLKSYLVNLCVHRYTKLPDTISNHMLFCFQFFENRFRNPNFSSDVEVSYWPSFANSYTNYWKYKLGFTVRQRPLNHSNHDFQIPENILNHVAFRLFFEKTVGFPNKKLRLLLNFKPEVQQEDAFVKYANPKSSYTSETTLKRSTLQG